jgi:hypothetical protein
MTLSIIVLALEDVNRKHLCAILWKRNRKYPPP